jgi:predicted secreted protein
VQAKGKPVAGGEIWEVFTFRTLAEGTTDLEFIYDRPWDKGSPPEKRYVLKVSVIR